MRTRTFLAYRGAHKNYARNIIDRNIWEKSTRPDEYFGHGIYFFEEDNNEAYNFAKYVRRISEEDIVLIQAYIKCNREEILDLIDSRSYEEYLKLVERIKNRYKGKRNKPKIDYPYDCAIINMICDKDGYKLVRGAYNPRNSRSLRLVKEGATRIPKTHIQLCVRCESIINDYIICIQ